MTRDERAAIRRMFCADVDCRIRKSMVDYLRGHFRYFTMNSWNGCRSYAHCIKVNRLPIRDGKYEMLESDEWQRAMSERIGAFDRASDYRFQIGVNGRSGGYLVLYQGGLRDGRVYTNTAGIDDCDDFDSWSMDALRSRVETVRGFDECVFDIVCEFVWYCERFEIMSIVETVEVEREAKILVARIGGEQ